MLDLLSGDVRRVRVRRDHRFSLRRNVRRVVGWARPGSVWMAIGLALLQAIAPARLLAAELTWVGNTNASFGTATNWNSGTVPLNGDVLIFDAAGTSGLTLNNNLTAAQSVGGFTFNAGAGAYVLNGNAVTLTGDIIDNSLSPETINLNIATTSQRTISLINGANLTLGGIISGTGGGLNLVNSSGTGNVTVTLSGLASTNVGTFTLNSGVTLNWNKTVAIGGSGTALIINGGTIDNTSGVAISFSTTHPTTWAGDFSLGAVGASGTTHDILFGSGSPVTITGGTRTVNVLGGMYTIAGNITSAGFGIVKSGAGTLVLSGIVNTGTAGLTVNAGTLLLSQGTIGNSYTGDTTVNGGVLRLAGAVSTNMSNSAIKMTGGTLDLSTAVMGANIPLLSGSGSVTLGSVGMALGNATDSTPFNGIVSGAGALIKVGSGTVTLGGGNLQASTVVRNGTLLLDFSQSGAPTVDVLSSSSLLTMNGGNLLVSGAADAANSQTFAATTTAAGRSTITATSSGAGTMRVSLAEIARATGGLIDFALPASGTINAMTSNAAFAGGSQTILGGYATVGGTTFAVSGTGATAGTITGLASYNMGFAAGMDVDAVPGLSMPDAMTINSLRFNTEGAYTVETAGNLNIATGGLLLTPGVGTNSVVINGNELTSGNGQDLILNQLNTAGTLTINSAIVGAIALTKAGAGTVVLGSSANSYSGGTYLQSGRLQLGSATAIPAGALTFGTTTTNGVLDLNGFSVKLSSLSVAVGATALSQFIGNSSLDSDAELVYENTDLMPWKNTSTFSGRILAALDSGTKNTSLRVVAGTLNLTGINGYSGGTTIGGGRLSINADAALGFVPATFSPSAIDFTNSGILTIAATGQTLASTRGIAVAAGATAVLEMPNIAAVTIGGTVSGTGNLKLDGGGSFGATRAIATFNGGANALSGLLTVNNGMTLASSGNSTWLNAVGLALNGGSFTIANSTSTPIIDRLRNDMPITVNSGTLNYNNTASSSIVYNETIGAVTLASGALNIAFSGAMSGTGQQTLTLTELNRTGLTSTVTFSAGTIPNATINRIKVTGAATPTGQIVGPWATVGSTAIAQNDFAFYDSSGFVVPAAVAPTTDDLTWPTTYSETGNVNMGGTTVSLINTRILNTLRYSATTAGTLTLGANNLQTYGILSGGTSLLTISGTGAVSTPAGGGSLYLIGGSSTLTNGLTINAPVTDNGGAVGLVVGGAGLVTLTNTNSFSGGIVINSGYLTGYSDASFGAAGAVGTPANMITFNGSGQLNIGSGVSTTTYNVNRSITINNGAMPTIQVNFINNASSVTVNIAGAVTGSGGFIYTGTTSDVLNLNSTSNTFAGAIEMSTVTTAVGVGVGVASLADSATANGNIRFRPGNTGSPNFWLNAAAVQPLTLDYRQFELIGGATSGLGGGGVGNLNADPNVTLTVNSNLIVTGAQTHVFSLVGTNTGNNAFGGVIPDGTGTALVKLVKSGAGTWMVGSADGRSVNTFSGGTTISAGTLIARGGGSLGTGLISIAGGILELRSDVNNDMFGTAVMSASQTINVGRLASGSNLTLGLNLLNVTAATTATLTTAANVGGYTLALAALTQTSSTGTTLTVANASNMSIGNFITSSTTTPKLSFTGTANVVITGNITQGAAALALDRSVGTGTLILKGTSNLTGAVTIAAGTIQTAVATGALGSPSSISIGAAGTLALRADSNTTFGNGTNPYAVALSASGATINVDRVATAAAGTRITLGTVSIPGAYTLNVNGGGGVGLNLGMVTNPSTAAAATVINNTIGGGGSLTLSGFAYSANTVAQSVTLTGSGDTTIDGGISQNLANALSLIYAGSGTLTLNAASSYSGGTTIISGTVRPTVSGAFGSGLLTLSGGALEYHGFSDTLGMLNFAANTASSIVLSPPSGGGDTILYTSGDWLLGRGGTISIVAPTGTHLNVNNTQFTAGQVLNYVAVTDSIGTGFGQVVASSTGVSGLEVVRRAFAINPLAADTDNGALDYGVSSALGNLNLTLAAGTHSLNSLSIDTTGGVGTLALAGQTIGFTSGNVSAATSVGNDYTISGAGRFGTAFTPINILTSGDGRLILNSQLGIETATLTLLGSGTTVLGGTQIFTGPTAVRTGTLILNATSMAGTSIIIGDGAVVADNTTSLSGANSVSFSLSSSGTFSLNGNDVTLGGLASNLVSVGTPIVQNGGSSNATLTFAGITDTFTGTYAGVLQDGGLGTLALRLNSGTLALGGTNTYTGGTTLAGGRLSIASDAALGAVPTTFNASAVNFTGSAILSISATGQTLNANRGLFVPSDATAYLEMPNVAAFTVAGSVSGSGNFTLDNGVNEGALVLGSATFGGAANILSGLLTINNGLTLNNTGNSTWLNIAGLVLNGGTFTITNTAATPLINRLRDDAPITVNSGTLNYNNTASSSLAYNEAIGFTTLASGTLNIALSGTMTASGSQTLTLAGLNRTGLTSTATFSTGTTPPDAVKNKIVVTGATQTPALQIIGPWATTGTSAAVQTDYAVYNAAGQVIPAGIGQTANDLTWTAAYALTSNFNLSGATTLSSTRNLNSLRYSGAASAVLTFGANNLYTYGILNGTANLFTVGPATPDAGVLSTPSGGGNLFLTMGNAAAASGLTINDAITDNGGAVTLVISGNTALPISAAVPIAGGYGAVTLAGANTFSGGIVINNGGALVISTDANLGAAGNGLTFNGSGTLGIGSASLISGAFTNRPITVNNGGVATINTNLAGTYTTTTWTGKISGSGGIAFSSTTSDNIAFNSTNHDFLGPVIINGFSNASLVTMLVGSLADSPTANGAIVLNPASGTGSTVFGLSTAATQSLVLNYRQVELAGGDRTGISLGGLSNMNGSSSITLTVNTDLVNLTTIPKTLNLLGSNLGNNTFSGRINDGVGLGVVGLLKSGTGTWLVGSADGTLVNTYSGGTTINGGILVSRGSGSLGTGPLTITGATLFLRSDIPNDVFGPGVVTMSGNAIINVDQIASGANLRLGINTLNVIVGPAATLTTAANANGFSLAIGAITQTVATGTTLTIANASPLVIGSFRTTSTATPRLSFTGAANATITGNITQGTVPLGLDRSTGAGTLILQGTSNMTGAVTIVTGTIQTAVATNAFGSTTGISIGAAGTLALRSDTSATFGNGSTAYPIAVSASGATINLDRATSAGTGQTFTLGTLTMEGAYTLNVVGSNNSSLRLGTLSTAITSAPNRTFNNMLAGSGTLTVDSVVYTANVNNPQLTVTGIGATVITNGITQTAGTGSLVKTGTGSLTIAGTTNILGNVTVNGGSLTFNGPLQSTTTAGTSIYYGPTTGTTSILNVNADITATGLFGSTTANTIAIYDQTAGNVTIGTIAAALNGAVAGGAGYANFNLRGGTFTHGGRFTTTAGNSTGVVNVSGGTLNANGELFMVAYNANVVGTNARGDLNITGGSVNHLNSNFGFYITYDSGVNTTGSTYGVINIAGGDLNIGGTTAGRLAFGNASTTNSTGIINVAAGTLNMNGIVNGITTGTNDAAYINLSGGTVKAYADNTFVPADSTGNKFYTTLFGPVVNDTVLPTAATNFAGGVTFDSNGFTQTISTAIRGASGFGVTQADIGDLSSLAGNSGYIGSPAVTFSSAGVVAGGTPASGYSVIDPATGKLTAIVITSPGTYASGTTPTITLGGGGGTIGTINLNALTTANTNTGGLTKIGTGSLVLAAAATHGGATTVSAGTLKLNVGGSINLSPLLSIAGGATFDTTALAGYALPAGQTLAMYSTGIATFAGATATKIDATLRTLDLADGTDLGTLAFTGNGLTLDGSTLKFDLGAFGSDAITISGSAAISGSNIIELTALTGLTSLSVGTHAYTLVTASGGGWNSSLFSLASLTLAVNGLVYDLELSGDANTQWLDVTAPAPIPIAYWKGGTVASDAAAGRSWSAYSATFENNFTLADGVTTLHQLPSDTTNVFFAGSGALAADLATTLDRSFTINSLNFTGTTGSSPIGIAPGTGTNIALTLMATNINGNTDNHGITVASGTMSPITISTDIALGGDQTWHNDGAAGLIIGGSKITGSNMQLTIDGTGDTTIDAVLQMTRDAVATDQFIKAGSGKLTLTANNTYSLPTTINGGILEIAGAGTLGDSGGIVTLAAGTTLQFNQSTTLEVGNYIRSDSGDHGLIRQIGVGTTILTNDNMEYGGAVVVSNGTLVSVASGSTGPLYTASSVTVGASGGDSARLVASGTLNHVAIGDQGVFSPGASSTANHEVVGSVEATNLSLAAGSTYTFQFLGGLRASDPSGSIDAGEQSRFLTTAQSGAWDLLYATTLDLSGVDADHKIKLQLVTMSDSSTAGANPATFGDASAFDPNAVTPETSLHWLFASTTGLTADNTTISGDINDYFSIDTTQVTSTPLAGSFYVTRVDNDLYLNYAAVPEPGSLLLVGVASLGFGLYRRRRRNQIEDINESATFPLPTVAEASLKA